MKFGVSLPAGGPMAQPEQLSILSKHAEDLGFDVLTIPDHIVIPERVTSKYPYTAAGEFKSSGEFLEQLTLLSFIAAKTYRIRLMSGVMILPHRHPLLAAKMLVPPQAVYPTLLSDL